MSTPDPRGRVPQSPCVPPIPDEPPAVPGQGPATSGEPAGSGEPAAAGAQSPDRLAGSAEGCKEPPPVRPLAVPSSADRSLRPAGAARAARPVPVAPATATTIRTDEPSGAAEDLASHALQAAPPWLTSLVFHMVLLLIAGLYTLPGLLNRQIDLTAVYAEDEGVQLQDDTLKAPAFEANNVTDPVFAPDANPVEDPLAAPPDIDISLNPVSSSSGIAAPAIGLALTGREKGMKEALLAAYGGTATTEAAVDRGLRWLQKQQKPDGSWSLLGDYSDGNRLGNENKTAATAMALLAFQGAGHTHLSGKYREVVKNGWDALLAMQNRKGDFFREGLQQHHLYSQGIATIAVCELYGMTKDSQFLAPAQKSLDYAAEIQTTEGGWRYAPKVDSDTSVTGWFVMAFQSGRMAGLKVSQEVLDNVSHWLDKVSDHEEYGYPGSRYSYKPYHAPTITMTAEGLLCRQYLGWEHGDPRLSEGVAWLSQNPVMWDGSSKNVYYWYYATQVMHHMGGADWDRWNRVMRQVIPENQVCNGKETGSWDPRGDQWGNYGGRLYETCLCIYMLEVYYRHLPIYSLRGR